MIIHEITEECFKKYGKVIDSIDLTELVSTMQTVEIPADVVYEPSISALEKLKCATELQQKTYGELPIQIGWCIGNNHKPMLLSITDALRSILPQLMPY